MKRGFYAQRRDGRKTISHFYEVYTKDNPEKIVGRTLPLTGALWDFDAIDMTYLFFEIERAFSIHIPPKMLEEYRFNSINGIISIIEDLLKNN